MDVRVDDRFPVSGAIVHSASGSLILATGLAFLPGTEIPEPPAVLEPPTAPLLACAAALVLIGALRRRLAVNDGFGARVRLR